MGRTRRIIDIVAGCVMLLVCFLLMTDPGFGYGFAILFLIISMIAYGVRLLAYYVTMARFKVGGISVLYKGLLILDAGLFALCLKNVPKAYGLLYLLGCLLVDGIVDILKANEARKLEARHWRYRLFFGSGKILIAFSGLFFLGSGDVLILIYCAGLAHSAITKIINALRRTEIVYIN
ncbi:MAG: hypothetical protein K6B28_01190 [Lachnospiraceae bacterium]|nr:hypothetical protein [Lachnospiraceae bacterium]